MNTSREDQKGGASPEEAVVIGLYVRKECPHLELNGFMTIGSVENSDKVVIFLLLLLCFTIKIPNPDFDVLADVRRKFAEAVSD